MADNTERIAEIREILSSGVQQHTNDGTTVLHNFGELRKELRRLLREDDSTGNKRPSSFAVDLGGF